MTRAQHIAEAIWPGDAASRWLGMKLEAVRPGYARLSMRVTENMVNAQKVCHGGLVFAAGASIQFLASALLHETLVSECRESAQAGRRGIYDAKVTNEKGDTIALFRGESATVRGTWIA